MILHRTRRCGLAVLLYALLFTIPTVSTQTLRINAHRLDHIIQTMITQRGEVHLLTDLFNHGLVFFRIRISVFLQCLIDKITNL